MTWILLAASLLAALAILLERPVAAVLSAVLAGWLERRGNRRPGRHRPETLVVVDDLHLISYPHLYRRYQQYVERYGRGAEQAWYWCWRVQRKAELLQSAANRKALADYRWLVLYEQTTEMPAVTSS